MDRGGAAEGDERAAGHPLPPLDGVRARRVGHVLVHHLADAERGELRVEPKFPAHASLDRGFGPPPVEGNRASGEKLRIDPPQGDVRVRHGGFVSAPSVCRRPRLRPGARGSHLDPLQVVDSRDRPAPGPDFHHLDDGNPHRQPAPLLETVAAGDFEGPGMERPTAVDHAQLRRRPAHVEGEDVAQVQTSRQVAGEDSAPGGPGFHETDRSGDRRLERRESSARGHEKERTGEARLPQRLRESREVAGHERLHVGVRARRRLPLVLAHLRAHVRGQRHREPRPPRLEDLADPPLVIGVGVAVDEPDRDGFHPLRLERRQQRAHRILLQRDEDVSAVVDPLLHREPEAAGHQGFRTVDPDVVLLEAVLVRHLQRVAVPGGDDQRRARPPPLDDRVGGQRGAVDDETHGGGRDVRQPQHLVHAFQDAALRGRGGRKHLRRHEAPAGLQRHVREGSPDVDREPGFGHGSAAHPSSRRGTV